MKKSFEKAMLCEGKIREILKCNLIGRGNIEIVNDTEVVINKPNVFTCLVVLT